jgi:hypothetical protein
VKTLLLFLLPPIAYSVQLLAQDAPPSKVEPKGQDQPGLIDKKDAPLSVAPNNHIAISKRSIGKEFLISASVIPQIVSPTSTSLAGKLVRFEVFHDGVDLYESTDGLVVTKDLPARRLLTTFPIVSQNDQEIVIDFNAGMRRVFNDIWYASGGGSGRRSAVSETRALEIPQARVFEVRSEGDLLIVRQSAQVRDRQADQNREDRYEIRYFISPYEAGDFKTKEHSPAVSRYVRFFESHTQLESTSGRETRKIALFDISKPVVIHYSANTPADYEEAVRDGILYWNRAFGKDVVRAEKAPEGVTAPDARFSLVQWVPWDSAGFAYADVIVDPRSGASQRGQAYMTSTFAISGRAQARALLRRMRTIADGKPGAPKFAEDDGSGQVQLPSGTATQPQSMFTSARACEVDMVQFASRLAAGLENALADVRFDDASVKRVSQDYVREVVAHEVGHVLGLRHNFAGSLSATLTHKQISDWFKSYLADDNTKASPEQLAASSVMEYNDLQSGVYIGWKIRTTKEVLPYDAAAIQWGYMGSTAVADKKIMFATDEDVSVYGDTMVFDYGPEPVVSAYADMGETLKNLPNSFIERFIAAKAPRDPRDKVPLEQLNVDLERSLARIVEDYAKMLSWFRSNRRSLRVEHAFPFVGVLNHKEVLKAHWKALNAQIEKLGGIDKTFFAFLPMDLKLDSKVDTGEASAVEKFDAKKFTERVAKLLETPAYTNFTGLDDKLASFTKDEKDVILARARSYFAEFEKELVKRICQRLEKSPRDLGVQATEEVAEDDIVAKLERRIVDVAREVITARNEEVRHKGKVDKALVEVVDFKYDLEIRTTAARMLADGNGSFRSWAVEPRTELTKQLKESVESALNVQNFKEFKEASLSRPLRDWYLNQQTVLGVLSGKMMAFTPPPTPPQPSVPPKAGH